MVAGAAEEAEQRGAGRSPTPCASPPDRPDEHRRPRSLLVDIYPPSLADTGLKPAIDDLVSGLRSRDIDVRLQVADDFPSVDPDSARLIFRVAQELLRNVVKHAKASVVEVSLAQDGSTIQLDIADDGIGFEPEKLLTARGSGHFGLRLLRDAVATADAQLSVASTPGRYALAAPGAVSIGPADMIIGDLDEPDSISVTDTRADQRRWSMIINWSVRDWPHCSTPPTG